MAPPARALVLAIALSRTHAVRDSNDDDKVDDASSGSDASWVRRGRVAASGATWSEYLSNLRAKEERGHLGVGSSSPADWPEQWAKQLDVDGARIVGTGSFGTVYVANISCNKTRSVAVKEVKIKEKVEDAVDTQEAEKQAEKDVNQKVMTLEAVRREFEISKKFPGKYFINVYDKSIRESEENAYILMEAAAGGDLLQYYPSYEGLSNATKLQLFVEVLRGVKAMHEKKYVHRDLKPENILLTGDCSKRCHAKVADFGLSCIDGREECRGVGGTPEYMAPELLGTPHGGFKEAIRSIKKGELRNDMWSLGVILHELLYFSHPLKDPSTDSRIRRALANQFPKPPEKAPVFIIVDKEENKDLKALLNGLLTYSFRINVTVALEQATKVAEQLGANLAEYDNEDFSKLPDCWEKAEEEAETDDEQAEEQAKTDDKQTSMPPEAKEQAKTDDKQTSMPPEAKPQTRRTSTALAVAGTISGLCAGGLPCFRPS